MLFSHEYLICIGLWVWSTSGMHPDIHNGDWQRLKIFSTKLVLSWWRRSMWQTHQLWLPKTCLGIESAQKLNFSALLVAALWVVCMRNWLICPPRVHIFIWQYECTHLLQYTMIQSAAIHTHACISKNQYKLPKFQQQQKFTFSHQNTTCYYFKWLQTLT